MQSIRSVTSSYINYCHAINLNSVFAQSVRWKRKPMWLPTAKSKLFKVPKRRPVAEDENGELHRLYCNYRTYYRSVSEYLKEDAEKKTVLEDQSVLDKIEEDDFNKCSAINDEWNKNIIDIRNIRLSEEWEATKKAAAEHLEKLRVANENTRKRVDAEIRKAKEESVTFITQENIDQAIDQALEEIISYNAPIIPNNEQKFGKDSMPLIKSSKPIDIRST